LYQYVNVDGFNFLNTEKGLYFDTGKQRFSFIKLQVLCLSMNRIPTNKQNPDRLPAIFTKDCS